MNLPCFYSLYLLPISFLSFSYVSTTPDGRGGKTSNWRGKKGNEGEDKKNMLPRLEPHEYISLLDIQSNSISFPTVAFPRDLIENRQEEEGIKEKKRRGERTGGEVSTVSRLREMFCDKTKGIGVQRGKNENKGCRGKRKRGGGTKKGRVTCQRMARDVILYRSATHNKSVVSINCEGKKEVKKEIPRKKGLDSEVQEFSRSLYQYLLISIYPGMPISGKTNRERASRRRRRGNHRRKRKRKRRGKVGTNGLKTNNTESTISHEVFPAPPGKTG